MADEPIACSLCHRTALKHCLSPTCRWKKCMNCRIFWDPKTGAQCTMISKDAGPPTEENV